MKKALYVATVDIHIKSFHLPYLKLLHDKGYEVHVATNGDEIFPFCDVKHQICIERSPFKLSNIKAIKQLRKIINEEKFDIIHCHTPMGAVVTRLAAITSRKKYKTRVIYTAHGFHFYKGAPLLNWLIYYPIEWYLSKFTDTIITINHEDEALAKKKFSTRCKNIKYIPGIGIDSSKFDIKMSKKECDELKKSLDLKENDFILACVARLDKNKNQRLLIECMRDLVDKYENLHLLLIGRDEVNGLYNSLVNSELLRSHIHFLGNRNDVPKLLHISNVVISVSYREGFGINLAEGLMSGKPVVGTYNRGHNEIIEDGYNGFLVDFDKEKIENIIEKLIDDKYLYDKIASNCKKSSEKFDIRKPLEIVKNIYIS